MDDITKVKEIIETNNLTANMYLKESDKYILLAVGTIKGEPLGPIGEYSTNYGTEFVYSIGRIK